MHVEKVRRKPTSFLGLENGKPGLIAMIQPTLDFDLNQVKNIDITLDAQVGKFDELRQDVRKLKFVHVEPVQAYSPISFVSIDGGMMGINFDPFEVNFIEIADSFGNETLKFLFPSTDEIDKKQLAFLDNIPEIRQFLDILRVKSIVSPLVFPIRPEYIMNIAELACIFNRIAQQAREPLLVLKDGLLRNKFLKPEHKNHLMNLLKRQVHCKLVGVAKRSKIITLLSSALSIEKKIPLDATGYIEIPLELEAQAYNWPRKLSSFSMGKLYVAKLSPRTNLVLTVEIPYNHVEDEEIYSENEISEIFGCLIKDSAFSFPTLGYPQTIMRAHEKAARTGFVASIWRQKIIDRFIDKAKTPQLKQLLQQSWLRDFVDKRDLGGT